MNFLENVQKGVLTFFNYPYFSKDIIDNLKGPIILHISDTPVEIYNYIFRIIDTLNPKYIIHTGDLADNIKLEIKPNRLGWYQEVVEKLVEGLEKNEATSVYYALGNHDDYETISGLSKRGTILDDDILTLEKNKLFINHYHDNNVRGVRYKLYGHEPNPNHYREKGIVGLNGLMNINIIDLGNKRVYHLSYPPGTNRARLVEFKSTGL